MAKSKGGFANLAKFNSDLQAFANRVVGVDLVRLQKMLALELLARLVLATPVDTGRARGNWQLSINAPKEGEVPLRTGEAVTTEGAATLAGLTPFATVFISNNLPYITVLNEGRPPGTQWSKQAPLYWFEAAVEAVRAIVR